MVPIMPLSTLQRRWWSRSNWSAVVVGEDDSVAGLEVAFGDGEGGAGEESVGGGAGSSVAVEGVGFGAGAGEEEGVAAGAVGVPPVVDGGGVHVVDGVVEVDASVVLVGLEGGLDVAVAELVEGGALPWFVLAPVDGEFGGSGAGGGDGGGEGAAGGDLGELVVVADEDDFGSGVTGGGDGVVEVDGAGHACFVDDHDMSWGERGVGDEAAEAGEGVGVDAGAFAEPAGGEGGWGDPDELVAGALVEAADGGHGVGLAGSGAADDDFDAEALGGHLAHHLGLVAAQCGQGRAGQFGADRRRVELAGGDRCRSEGGEQFGFQVEQAPAGPALFPSQRRRVRGGVVGGQGDEVGLAQHDVGESFQRGGGGGGAQDAGDGGEHVVAGECRVAFDEAWRRRGHRTRRA